MQRQIDAHINDPTRTRVLSGLDPESGKLGFSLWSAAPGQLTNDLLVAVESRVVDDGAGAPGPEWPSVRRLDLAGEGDLDRDRERYQSRLRDSRTTVVVESRRHLL